MCVNAVVSNHLGLVLYGTHGIEMQREGRRIAVFTRRKSVKRNWREAVMFALGWRQTLFYSASEAQIFADEHCLTVYTWQCFGTQNWLRRGPTVVDAYCYTVLPSDAPESVRLADDTMPDLRSDDSG
jgi:hypothetical protein